MDSVTLSGNEFKALASETRVSLIKLLQERKFTLSELAEKTGLAAPTVKQHLSILENAGIVELFDEGRKWKYYSLTRKGKKILSNDEPKNIFIILATGIVALGAVTYSFFGMLLQQAISSAPAPLDRANVPSPIATGAASAEIQKAVVATQPVPIPIETIIPVTVVIMALSIAIGFLIAKAKK